MKNYTTAKHYHQGWEKAQDNLKAYQHDRLRHLLDRCRQPLPDAGVPAKRFGHVC